MLGSSFHLGLSDLELACHLLSPFLESMDEEMYYLIFVNPSFNISPCLYSIHCQFDWFQIILMSI